MQKRYLKKFLTIAFLALLTMGLLSLQCLEIRKVRIKDLFRMDFVLYWLNSAFYPVGINFSPQKVVIGTDGWLYLGDEYERTLTVTRRPAGPEDEAVGRALGLNLKQMDAWLTGKGVRVFRVMIGPNKNSIYPEYMPRWVQHNGPGATDGMLQGAGSPLIMDLRRALLDAKSSYSGPLYYKTDTHWNEIGASVAFREFTRMVSYSNPELKWPDDHVYRVVRVDSRKGGDLSKFLWLQNRLTDSEPVLGITERKIETVQYDYESGKLLFRGGNPEVGAPNEPLLIRNDHALNRVRVLWLRDSYGTAMSPFMAATFSQVLQLHWRPALSEPARFRRLIEKWKPDYVFITVVERSMAAGDFLQMP